MDQSLEQSAIVNHRQIGNTKYQFNKIQSINNSF